MQFIKTAMVGVVLALVVLFGSARGQIPPLPPDANPRPSLPGHVLDHRGGGLRGKVHRFGFLVKDRMIGEPERFVEPPLGYLFTQNMNAQAARADQHWFTLYRSDFYAGTDMLSPRGHRRLTRIVDRWDCWTGPILIEADPMRPGLAETRRLAVLSTLARSHLPIDPDRLVVGGSPYFGQRGNLANEYNNVYLQRSLAAPTALPLPPLPVADFED